MLSSGDIKKIIGEISDLNLESKKNAFSIFNENIANFVCSPQETNLFKLHPNDMILANTENALEEFNCKKKLEAILTNTINTSVVFKKNVDQSERLQLLIIGTMNKTLKSYRERTKLNPDDVRFIYKGGSFLNILYNKYLNEIAGKKGYDYGEGNTRPYSLLLFLNNNSKWFDKGDSDYSLLINPKLPNFYDIYCDLNKLVYFCLLYIREEIKSNYEKYFATTTKNPAGEVEKNKFGLSTNNLKIMLENMNTVLQSDIKLSNPLQKCGEWANIEKITELSYFDIVYPKSNVSIEMQRKLLRRDFTVYKSEDKSYLKYLNIPTGGNINGENIFLSINDTNKFNKSNFCLQRLKINFRINYNNVDRTPGEKNLASELVDISVPKHDDHDMNQIFDHTDLFLKTTEFTMVMDAKENMSEVRISPLINKISGETVVDYNKRLEDAESRETPEHYKMRCDSAICAIKRDGLPVIHTLNVDSLSLSGFFLDTSLMLFVQKKPWTIDKGEKRVKRFLVLFILIIYEGSNDNPDYFNTLYNHIKKLLTCSLLELDKINEEFKREINKKTNMKTTKNQKLAKIINYFLDIYSTYIYGKIQSNEETSYLRLRDFIGTELGRFGGLKADHIKEIFCKDNKDGYDMCDNVDFLTGGKYNYKYKFKKYLDKIKQLK